MATMGGSDRGISSRSSALCCSMGVSTAVALSIALRILCPARHSSESLSLMMLNEFKCTVLSVKRRKETERDGEREAGTRTVALAV